MDVEIAIAALLCALLGLGHWALGRRWVLPGLAQVDLPPTPFGPAALSTAMLRFTWHTVTVLLLGFAGLLAALAVGDASDTRALLLRWFFAVWVAATALAVWQIRRRPASVLRFPVPVLFLALAVLFWVGST